MKKVLVFLVVIFLIMLIRDVNAQLFTIQPPPTDNGTSLRAARKELYDVTKKKSQATVEQLASGFGAAREWNTEGPWSGSAVLLRINRSTVVLKRENGKNIRVRMMDLSKEDLLYVIAKSASAAKVKIEKPLPKYWGPAYAKKGWFPTDLFPTRLSWDISIRDSKAEMRRRNPQRA